MTSFIPVNEPLLDGREKQYLMDCIDSGWISSEGPYVERFEAQWMQHAHRRHAIAVCNGSAALDTALLVLQLSPGDEVIMPTFTIISCAWAIIRAGATPVLVDCDPVTWNMTVEDVESKISSKTKAIMMVHIYGLPADAIGLAALAQAYNLILIEDAAQAIGQTCSGKPCGSFGDISVLSFYANKAVTTGEGGMLLTSCDSLAARCRKIRNLAFMHERRFLHEEVGFNYRMSNLQAAVGVAQMERLAGIIERKQGLGRLYQDAFQSLSTLTLPCPQTPQAHNIYWVFGLILNFAGKDAQQFAAALNQLGVGTRPFFVGMHRQPVFHKMGLFTGPQNYPVADNLTKNGLYLPSGLGLTPQQQTRVIDAVRQVLDEGF